MGPARLVNKPGELLFDPSFESRMDGLSRRAQIPRDGSGGPPLGMEFNDGESALSWICDVFKQREAAAGARWLGTIRKGEFDRLC